MAKNTNDLLDQLADNNCSIDDYLEENREDMIVLAAKDFWEAAIERSGMSKCNIINKADFNYCYFYDIVNGRKIARGEITGFAVKSKGMPRTSAYSTLNSPSSLSS